MQCITPCADTSHGLLTSLACCCLLQVHHSEVQLSFVQEEQQAGSSTSISFVYYPAGKLVGVYSSSKEGQRVLAEVDAADKGSFAGYELVQHLLPEAAASKYAAKPYR